MLAVDSVGFELETVVEGLNQPVTFDVAPDGRLFVAEKEGTVAIVENGVRVATFLDIRGRVNSFQDRGLLSLALDPDFDTNGYVYLNYAKEIDSVNPELNPGVDPGLLDNGGHPGGVNALGEVIRVTASAADPNVADMTTEVVVHDGFYHAGGSHSVGDIDFDLDDNLIFTWGDGGFVTDARLSAQDPDDPRAKLYRLNKGTFEGVPDNPFYEAGDPSSTRSRVWALGVRNSWKITVDQPTGDVYIAEVTDGGPEEINVLRRDDSTTLNYGWPWFTGDNASNRGAEYDPDGDIDGDGNVELPSGFVYESPFTTLAHRGSYTAIVGGAVYRGLNYPSEFEGLYFFSEIGSGDLIVVDQQDTQTFFGNLGNNEGVVDVQLGPDGNIWATSLFTGKIQRIVYTGNGPGIDSSIDLVAAGSRSAGVGPLTVEFDAGIPDDGEPRTYAWDFDGDGQTDSTEPRPTHTFTQVGRQIVELTVDGEASTAEQVIEIDVLASQPQDNNLALGKPTFQTNTRGGQLADGGAASRAVDGNTSGDFGNDSVTHTLETRTPFWEVDLETLADITDIQVFNRSGETGSRLNNFYVMVSDTPIDSGNPNAAVAQPGVTSQFFDGAAGSSETFTFDRTGRYVRVQLTSQSGHLQLAEVQVFGTAAPVARFLDPPGLLAPGSDLDLQIDAYDSGGLVSNVRLLLDGQPVRTENSAPYLWTGSNGSDPSLADLPTGEYTLSAIATDNAGLETTVERTIAIGIAGDFNRDGTVDAADYTVYRDGLGQSVDPFTSADGDGNGLIEAADRQVWVDNYGVSEGVSSASAVISSPVPVAAEALQVEAVPLANAVAPTLATDRRRGGGAARAESLAVPSTDRSAIDLLLLVGSEIPSASVPIEADPIEASDADEAGDEALDLALEELLLSSGRSRP